MNAQAKSQAECPNCANPPHDGPCRRKVDDPAGLDKLLLAAGKGCALFVEQLIGRKFGTRVNLWDGADGLGAILEESLKSAGVPNKRLPDLLTPRLVLTQARVIPKRPVRRLKR